MNPMVRNAGLAAVVAAMIAAPALAGETGATGNRTFAPGATTSTHSGCLGMHRNGTASQLEHARGCNGSMGHSQAELPNNDAGNAINNGGKGKLNLPAPSATSPTPSGNPGAMPGTSGPQTNGTSGGRM